MPRHYPDGIKVFSESVRSELIGAQHRRMGQNLTPDEKEALTELQNMQKEGKIVMQPGDKNAGIYSMKGNFCISWSALQEREFLSFEE